MKISICTETKASSNGSRYLCKQLTSFMSHAVLKSPDDGEDKTTRPITENGMERCVV